MLSIKVDISSLRALQNQLATINNTLANKGMRKALGATGKVLRDGLKQEVPTRSGLLKKSITFKVWKAKKTGFMMAKVGAKSVQGAALHIRNKTGKFVIAKTDKQRAKVSDKGAYSAVNFAAGKNRINPAKYFHLVNNGTKAHDIKTPFAYGNRNATIKHPGTKGKNLIAKAVSQYGSRAVDAGVQVLEQAIKEAAAGNG